MHEGLAEEEEEYEIYQEGFIWHALSQQLQCVQCQTRSSWANGRFIRNDQKCRRERKRFADGLALLPLPPHIVSEAEEGRKRLDREEENIQEKTDSISP